MEDENLIDGLLAGEEDSTAQIRRWIRVSFTPYRSRLASEIDDLEQEILLDLTVSLREGRYRRDSALKSYVKTFVLHKCIDRLRSLTRRTMVPLEDLELPSLEPSILELMTRDDETELALEVLEQMPDSCRELWRMLYAGLRYREMSQRLGVSAGSLRARVLRCRRRAIEIRANLRSQRRNKTDPSSTR